MPEYLPAFGRPASASSAACAGVFPRFAVYGLRSVRFPPRAYQRVRPMWPSVRAQMVLLVVADALERPLGAGSGLALKGLTRMG